jgi:VanZ family protein
VVHHLVSRVVLPGTNWLASKWECHNDIQLPGPKIRELESLRAERHLQQYSPKIGQFFCAIRIVLKDFSYTFVILFHRLSYGLKGIRSYSPGLVNVTLFGALLSYLQIYSLIC